MRDGRYDHNELERDARVIVNSTGSIQGVDDRCQGRVSTETELSVGFVGEAKCDYMCLLSS